VTGGSAEPLLEVADLTIEFPVRSGRLRAVDSVSLSLDAGKTLGIVGESGSGKSVLTRSIMGLTPGRSTRKQGTVTFKGQQLTSLAPKELRRLRGREIAIVMQDPMTSLNPVVRIGRQITEVLRFRGGMSRADAKQRAVDLLESVGISNAPQRLHRYPHEFSGGMRQRVVIAMAIACEPALLLADEPTTALDVTTQAQILQLLEDQQRERHMAMILVTHDLGVVATRTDRTAVMYAGQIVEVAPTRTLLRSMKMPYTEALLQSMPKLSDPSHTRLNTIPGAPPDLRSIPAGCRFAPRCPYAQDKCRQAQPPLIAAETADHLYRCWFPIGSGAPKRAAVSLVAEAG